MNLVARFCWCRHYGTFVTNERDREKGREREMLAGS